jgi:hypothetical protein
MAAINSVYTQKRATTALLPLLYESLEPLRSKLPLEQQMTGAAIQEMRSRFGEARFGQVCALLLALIFVGTGIFAILQGHEVSGASVAVTGGGIGIPAIIAAFMRGQAEKPPEPPPQPSGRQNPALARKSKK